MKAGADFSNLKPNSCTKKFFFPVFSDFISEQKVQTIIDSNSDFLKNLNYRQITTDDILKVGQIYYFVITGGTERQILDLQQKRSAQYPEEEVVLLAHAGNNSLPACLEVLARLQQDGINGKIIYLPEAKYRAESLRQPNIRSFSDNQTLSGKRIGMIGTPADWLVASSPTAETVKAALGAEVIGIELDELKQLFHQIGKEQVIGMVNDFIEKAAAVREASLNEIYDNMRIYLAMKTLISKYNLDAVTVRCFDLVLDLKTTGCFALSRMNDEGIIAGCEGDLVSTLGMMWAKEKSGKLPWMANPAQLDLKENSLTLAHCTVPCNLVSNYKIRSHFESGIGVGIQGDFPRQEVWMFRLGGRNLDKIWQAKGKIIQTGNDENLCRTQIKVKLNDEYSVQDLLKEPLGNHLVVT